MKWPANTTHLYIFHERKIIIDTHSLSLSLSFSVQLLFLDERSDDKLIQGLNRVVVVVVVVEMVVENGAGKLWIGWQRLGVVLPNAIAPLLLCGDWDWSRCNCILFSTLEMALFCSFFSIFSSPAAVSALKRKEYDTKKRERPDNNQIIGHRHWAGAKKLGKKKPPKKKQKKNY